jgi:flagellar M-ring protein FliF
LFRLNDIKRSGILSGLLASLLVVVVIIILLWPESYKAVYSASDNQEARMVLNTLLSNNIDAIFKDAGSIILVPDNEIKKSIAIMRKMDLPVSIDNDYNYLENPLYSKNINSILIEKVQIQHAKEIEVSRTIASLKDINSARVHFSLPSMGKSNQEMLNTRASVVVNIYKGHDLGPEEISAIVHLVTSSIPKLEANQVTIIDQYGRLLLNGLDGERNILSSYKHEFKRNIETDLTRRIENVLGPIIGEHALKIQVTADVNYNGKDVVKNIKQNENKITNNDEKDKENQNILKANAKNSLIDLGSIKRLSVAVIVDDKLVTDSSEKIERIQRTPEEIDRLTELVKRAIGYDHNRGDIVNVINTSFIPNVIRSSYPVTSIWKREWVHEFLEKILGITIFVLIILGGVRPLFKYLITSSNKIPESIKNGKQEPLDNRIPIEEIRQKYKEYLDRASKIAMEDPKLTAQIIKNWVASDGK